MTLGGALFWFNAIVRLVALLGVVLVLWKAVVAYRQHDSRPMLFLAVGLALLLVVAPLVGLGREVALDRQLVLGFLPGQPSLAATAGVFYVVESLLHLVGVVALLASLYVREGPATR